MCSTEACLCSQGAVTVQSLQVTVPSNALHTHLLCPGRLHMDFSGSAVGRLGGGLVVDFLSLNNVNYVQPSRFCSCTDLQIILGTIFLLLGNYNLFIRFLNNNLMSIMSKSQCLQVSQPTNHVCCIPTCGDPRFDSHLWSCMLLVIPSPLSTHCPLSLH